MAGSLRQRGVQSWELRVHLGRDPESGKKQYASRTVRGSKREAERALARLVAEVEDGAVAVRAGSVRELCEAWFAHVEQDLSPSTAHGYRRILDRRILPKFGDTPLRKLRAADLDRWYGELRRRGSVDRGPLAPNTVMRVHAVFHRTLAQAVRWGWITNNPANNATPGRPRTSEILPPSPEDVVHLIEAAAKVNPALPTYLRLAAVTGARRGELCALRWKDVDFRGRQLVISRALVQVGSRVIEKDTKTHAARNIGLDAGTLALLDAHRTRRTEVARSCGGNLGVESFVFSHEIDGALPWRPAYATLAFVRLRNELGLERVRLHDLRHFTATRLLAGGQDVRTVSGRLGHANAATTLGVYAHFLEAADHDAAKVIGKLLDTSPAPGKLSHPLRTVPDVTELIVFDGDDTLWRVEHLYDAARSRAAEVVAREGLDPVAWAALQRQIDVANVQHFGLSRLRFPQSSVEAYEQLATESGVTVKPAVRDRVRSAAATVFDRKAPLMPGVREVLRTLKRDHRLALLTQGDPSIQKKRIGESGLGDFLDFIRVVDRKDEASFSTVLDALTTSPSAAWSVGNSIPSDINPALRLGMSAIWIEAPVWAHERREDGPAAGSFFVCKSLSDVPGLIRGHALVGQ